MSADINTKFELQLTLTPAMLDSAACPLSLLAEQAGLPRSQVKLAMQKGALWFQPHARGKLHKIQRLRRLSRSFNEGDKFFLNYDPHILAQKPLAAELVCDKTDYSIWYKPYGMYAQGSKWGDHCTISRWAETHIVPSRPAFIVHRLDRATSGLMILAHTKKAAQRFSRLFEERGLEKTYHAIVYGVFPESELTIQRSIDSRPACSHIQLLSVSRCRCYSLLSVVIDTGRKHQIRRHLSEAGFAIVGDRLYGPKCSNDIEVPDLQLTAYQLRFNCPISGKPQCFTLKEEQQLRLL